MHDRSESRALRLLGHLPVAHAPELFVRDALNQIGHCLAEAISLAKELNDMHGLAVARFYAAVLGYFELNPAVVEHLASDLIELSNVRVSTEPVAR